MRQEDRMQKNKPQELVKEKACRPFGLRDKLGYLFGDFGNDFSFIFASTYLMVFYTKVLGISGAVVGTLFPGSPEEWMLLRISRWDGSQTASPQGRRGASAPGSAECACPWQCQAAPCICTL